MKYITLLVFSFFISVNTYGYTSNDLNIVYDKRFFNDEEFEYLNKNKKIRVGVFLPSHPPFDMIENSGQNINYTGMSSDVVSIISDVLGLSVEWFFFESKSEAINALLINEIDLIPSANSYFLSYGLILSEPYFSDLPIIFRSSTKKEIKKVSVAYDYLSPNIIDTLIQDLDLNIEMYPSRNEAIAAAAFGETDAVITDLLSLNYSFEYNYIGDLIYQSVLDEIDTQGISFALNKDSNILLSIINKSIRSISKSTTQGIIHRWNGSGVIPPTIQELRFIRDKISNIFGKEEVSIVISPYQPPFSYVDKFGNPQGVLIELLNLFNLYSGVDFNIIIESEFEKSIALLANEHVDLMAMNISDARQKDFIFSNSLFSNPFVFVTNKNIDINEVKKVFVTRKNIIVSYIQDSNYEVYQVESYLDAFKKVTKNKKSAAIIPISVANYYITKYHHNDLIIQKYNSYLPLAKIALAANKKDNDIILFTNSLLELTPRSQLESISGMWRKNTVIVNNSWKDYKYTVYTLSISFIVFLILFSVYIVLNKKALTNEIFLKNKNNEQLKFLQNLIDSIPHPVYFVDKKFKIKVSNEQFKCFFNGNSTFEFLEKFGKNQFVDIIKLHKDALESNLDIGKDNIFILDNKRVIVYHWVRSCFDRNNNINGVIGGWLDVSERANLLDELENAKLIAEEANSAKSVFLTTVSHEIRTPMNIIIGALDLVLNFDYSIEEKNSHLRMAYSSAKDLLGLIGDILDISKIEAKELSLEPKKSNLKEVIESMFNMFLGLSKQKNIQLIKYYDANIHDLLIFDELRFKQILLNLIGNAVKFTDKGSVELNVFDIGRNDGNQRIKIVIKDTGVGIKDDELDKLFKAFSQTSSSKNRGGTGLGLMISKQLCTLMGGSLHLNSQFGTGTTIVCEFLFPMVEQTNTNTKTNTNTNTNTIFLKKKVLLVDDHPSNRIILSKQIEKIGHDVLTSIDGYDALSTLRHNLDIDVIITDCHMPNMDGYELTKRIRTDLPYYKNIIILGLTANAQVEIKEKCINSGMNDCLFKPLDIKVLENIMQATFCSSISDLHLEETIDEKTIYNLREVGVDLSLVFKDFLSTFEDDILKLEKSEIISEKMELIHRIKSASNMLGFKELITICKNIEDNFSVNDTDIQMLNTAVKKINEIMLKKNFI